MQTFRQPFSGSYPITQRYGEFIEGVSHNGKPHTGIDYACPEGTQILASGDGIVRFAGMDTTGYGKMIIIDHGNRKATVYAHLSSVQVWVGKTVMQGSLIGLSGWSGDVYPSGPSGAHLHFEARQDWWDHNDHRDPVSFLPLMNVDDAADAAAEKAEVIHPDIPEGVCLVRCTAFVRDWKTLERKYLVYPGELVYAFSEKKEVNGLPFRFIGANLCMAEYDSDGTQILEIYNGDKEE